MREQSEQEWSFFLIGISMYVKKIRLWNLKLIKLINYVLAKNGIFHAYGSQTLLHVKAILNNLTLPKSVTVFSLSHWEIRLTWNQISCVEPALLYEDLWDTQDIE